MNKWYLPLTVLGLGGLGVLFGTERGREVIGRATSLLEEWPEMYADWQEAAEREIQDIQSAVDQIATKLGAMQTAQ